MACSMDVAIDSAPTLKKESSLSPLASCSDRICSSCSRGVGFMKGASSASSRPPSCTKRLTAEAAPPELERSTTGQPSLALASTVASVPGPPCTTRSTMGTARLFIMCCSISARTTISEPHALRCSRPESMKRKWLWCGEMGAPSTEGLSGSW